MSNLLFTNGKACLNYLYNYRNEEVMKSPNALKQLTEIY